MCAAAAGIGALAPLAGCLLDLDLAYCYQIKGATLQTLSGLQSLNLHWCVLMRSSSRTHGSLGTPAVYMSIACAGPAYFQECVNQVLGAS